MSDDIVDRLRQAADEIERLRRNQSFLFERLGKRTAERDRLRDGIAQHKQDVPNTPSYLSLEADRRLWALIEDGDDG